MSRALAAAVALAVLAPAAPALAAKRPLGPGERVDLNRATISELKRLPGVGDKRAQAIVAQRARKPFQRPEDVLAVKGVGRAWLEKVKANVTAGAAGPPPLAPSH